MAQNQAVWILLTMVVLCTLAVQARNDINDDCMHADCSTYMCQIWHANIVLGREFFTGLWDCPPHPNPEGRDLRKVVVAHIPLVGSTLCSKTDGFPVWSVTQRQWHLLLALCVYFNVNAEDCLCSELFEILRSKKRLLGAWSG